MNRVCLSSLVVFFLISQSFAANQKIPVAIAEAMQDQDFRTAIERIDQTLNEGEGPSDYLVYLKGRAFYHQKEYTRAIEIFDGFAKTFPDSPWIRRVEFAKAMAHARGRDFRAAQDIYRNEAEFLLSADRKNEIAEIYLQFAHEFYKPKDETTKPDFEKAAVFFQKAIDVAPNAASNRPTELLVAKCWQNLKKFDDAINQFKKLINEDVIEELDVDARFHLGECYFSKGQLKEARRVWQDLLSRYGDKNDRSAEASYQLALTYRLPNPLTRYELDLGVAAMKEFLANYPNHKSYGKAHLLIANSYRHLGQFEKASQAIEDFLEQHEERKPDETAEARFLLGQCFQLQKRYDKALSVWREYLAKHPAHKRWSETQQQVITTEFLIAFEKRIAKKFAEARNLWDTFLTKYPLDSRAPQILYSFGEMNFKQEKWEPAIEDWRKLISKHPGTEFASMAQMGVAVTLEEKLGRLEDALKEFKKVTWGSQVNPAKQRVARLIAKQMSIQTERVFRTDEEPTIKLTSRNIEKVSVRVYKIDLETYFRKMHLATGVEALDIALIDPDNTFDFEVRDFEKYKQSELEIPIKTSASDEAGGVTVVTVSSDTLEATTMVVQSDLDIIVKSSRDEVFVYAQNMRTGKPWADVKLLLSNGSQLFGEATTGQDGVFQRSYKELKETHDVRVFAVANNNAASNVINLRGLGVSRGLSNKGYLYTDRPAYRPGQSVNVRGIVRKVANDTYKIEDGKVFKLTVSDARNRTIWKTNVKLNRFGTFHNNFTIPSEAIQGNYRIQIEDEESQKYHGSFIVQQFKLNNIQLSIDTERNIFYRGEKIVGTISAQYYFGGPLANRNIRYRLGNDRFHSAKTDSNGEVKFELETRDLAESQTLPIHAEFPEYGLATSRPVVIATQGYSLSLSTVRSTYVSGESFEVTVSSVDAEGNPASRDVELSVLEQTRVNGRQGERLIEKRNITTNKEDGVGRATFSLEKGATYVLRAEGTDRFSNPITGQHLVTISDDKDKTRLRILADQHTFRVGDTPKIRVLWREAATPALITYQGASVLGYRLVDLQQGVNQIEVPMQVDFAPNFELAVAVMVNDKYTSSTIRRFHTAASPFTVQRDLHVRMEGPAKAVVPGQDVEIDIATTDRQGRPVTAEVSLAMVEQALVDRFGTGRSQIAEFFGGTSRQMAVRTTSSVSFQYAPKTKAINNRLLAEAERAMLNAAENARLVEIGGRVDFFASDGGAGGAFGGRTNRRLAEFESGPSTVDELGQIEDLFEQREALNTFQAPSRGVVAGEINQWSSLSLRRRSAAVQSQQIQGNMTGFLNGQLNGSAHNSGVWFEQARRDGITAFYKNGEVRQFSANAIQIDGRGLIDELRRAGAVVRPTSPAEETGYWNPSIVTDEQGKATLRVTVPDRSTSWKLVAQGITQNTLAGEVMGKLVAKKSLFGELKLPGAYVDGDVAQIQATIHNYEKESRAVEVVLKTTIGGKTISQNKRVEIEKDRTLDLNFPIQIRRPENSSEQANISAKFELVVKSGNQLDRFERNIPLNAHGMPVFGVTNGVSESDTTAWVELPESMPISSPSLEIAIGPSIQRNLLDILFGSPMRCQIANQRIAPASDSISSDLMAAVALHQLFARSREKDSPILDSIDDRIQSAIGQLAASQAEDGGWSWTGRGKSDRYTTARTVWAMSSAEQAGYGVPAESKAKALAFLRSEITKISNTDYESKAVLLHAITVADKGDFPLANRLYRNRQSLTRPTLLYLALALAEMQRLPMAEEILTVVASRNVPADGATLASKPWSSSFAESQALYALALQSVSPNSPNLDAPIQWLNSNRFGFRWAPDKATGPAAMALCQWSKKTRFSTDRFALDVIVNGTQVSELSFEKDSATQVIRIPSNLLRKGKQRINFQMTGRGHFAYQCVMEGFVSAKHLKSTTDEWRIRRKFEPSQLEVGGKLVRRGFDVLRGNYRTFQNVLNELPVGKRGHITLNAWRTGGRSSLSPDQLEYLVITEPLPSGVRVDENSIKGAFERYELSPGQITFFVGNRRSIGTISYEVHGYLPGKYNAAPTVVRDAYRLDRIATSDTKGLTVLTSGEKSSDDYRLSPRELYELGKWRFANREMKDAIEHLTELVDKWNLDASVYQDATRMLLDAHLAEGHAQGVVKHFEVIKERWPELEISYDKILKIGAAYHEIGEFERSYLIFRATVESSFLTESQVAGFLQSQNELLRSVEVMDKLIREYPPEPYVAAATFDLAQEVYSLAPKARTDEKLRDQKITRVDLVQRGAVMLNSFLTAYPNDPAADKAAFSLASALLELEQYQKTIQACQRFVSRYSQSEDLDSFLYTIGYCHFALGNHKDALDICARVSDMKAKDPKTGRMKEAENRFRAIYILGQVYHSLGKAAEAIKQYGRVADKFPDAKEAIEYFSRRDISLPEVTTVDPKDEAKVKLDFRNVASCELRVYRIDLLKFSLLRRNLSGITNINLSGVSPLHEETIQLGDGRDYRDRSQELSLPITEEGAYLVVCRGENLHASGLVLISPLKIEVQEDASSGRIRTTVKDITKDSYVSDVHIKVIGTSNQDFVSGETDLRGLFVADGIQGKTTVIARADSSRYAFYRGDSFIGDQPQTNDAPNQSAANSVEFKQQKKSSGKDELLKGIRGRNSAIMLDNRIRQKSQYFNDKSGVTVDAVK